MQNFTEIAIKYFNAGFYVLPTKEDKTPANTELYGGSWDKFKTAQSIEDVKRIFSRQCHGIALITGVNDLEVIDIDCKYDIEDSLLSNLISAIDLAETGRNFIDFPIASTKNGGFHLFYRSPGIEGNKKLALRETTEAEKAINPDERVKVLIETRGKYGYVIAFPTPGYAIDNGTLTDVPVISKEERIGIINAAKSLNQFFDYSTVDRKEANQLKVTKTSDGITAWDDYNNRIDAVDYLESKGWTRCRQVGQRIYMRRPGKDKGFSGNYHEGHGLFFTFTTSTELPSEKSLSAYGLYTYIEHRGDFSASARTLYRLGYGSQTITSETQVIKDPEGLWEELQQFRFDPAKKPPTIDFVFNANVEGEYYDVASFGNICMITGLPKSMKTTFLRGVMASGLNQGGNTINMSLDLRGRRLLSVDTEQPEIFWHSGNNQLLKMAGWDNKPSGFDSFVLRQYDSKKRMAAIEIMLQKLPDVGCLVLDGLVDLVEDYNDQKECTAVINTIMRWTSEYNLLCFLVLHLGKGNHEMLGALGSISARKCDVEIRMNLHEEEGLSEVRHKLARTKPFKPFKFHRNDDGVPVLEVGYQKPEQPTPQAKQFPHRSNNDIQQSSAIDKPLNNGVLVTQGNNGEHIEF